MLRYYQHSDSLPIWNYDKVHSENELRYMLRLTDYDKLPNINKRLKLLLIYHYGKISGEFKSPILKLKRNVIVAIKSLVIDIAQHSNNEDKIEKASIILRGLMIDPTQEQLLWNVDFTETPEQRQKLTLIGVELKKYNEKIDKKKDAKPVSLYEQQVRIESILGVHINIRECTVKQFQVYSQEARIKANLMNKGVN